MSEFPRFRLGDLCEKITDGTHHSPRNLPHGAFKYITAKNVKPWGLDLTDLTYVDELTHREIYSRCDVRKGDILYIKDGATTGIAAINPLDEEFSLLSSVGVLRPGPAVSAKYLLYALQDPATKSKMMDGIAGVAITRLTLRKLNDATVPVAPLGMQDRIVEKLEELLSDLDAGVAELKVAQKKLALYRQSLLKAAVEGALTAKWRESQRGLCLSPLSPRGRGVGGEGVAPVPAPWLTQRARTLRREQTPAEQSLWYQLRAKRFSGFKFRRQQPIGRYIVDFVCFERKLIIELDGGQHAEQHDYDEQRDDWLRSQGFTVLRFWNNEWTTQSEPVLEAVWQALQEEPSPLPNPSPTRGEGLQGETGAQLLERILTERRARWEAKQLAKFKEQGKTPPKDWQKKYPEPAQPDTSDLPKLPEGWVWASIEQVSSDERYSLSIGPFGSNLKVPDYRETGVPLVFVRNIRSGNYGGAFTKYVTSEKARELSAHSICAGDVLVTKMGEPPGDADVYPNDQPPAVITADCIKIRCSPGLMEPLFLKTVINSHIGKRQIEPMTQGVAQKKVSLGRFIKLAVPVPPVDEQAMIIEMVMLSDSEASEQLTAVQRSLKQSAAQRQNILRAAFSGELVPQDPNDEPASVLLARIRAERAARESGAQSRGRRKKAIST